MSLTEISKYISLILRHKPEVIGITLDEHGWAEVEPLIQGIKKTKDFNMEMLEQIVETDNKKRYSFNEDKTKIRANQGHSIQVDVELKKKTPPEFLWHGTAEKYVSAIEQQGLLPKSRLYVHLSEDIETASNVGNRHGNVVVYKVLSKKMEEDGYKFYYSKNGVWLIKKVPAEYLQRMSRNEEFLQILPVEIKKHHNDLRTLRECLIKFKDSGMNKESMLQNLEKLRSRSDSETEDILLDLMDFVTGYCNPELSIYKSG